MPRWHAEAHCSNYKQQQLEINNEQIMLNLVSDCPLGSIFAGRFGLVNFNAILSNE